MARGTVRDLAAPYSRHVESIVVADALPGAAREIVAAIADRRTSAVALDVRDGAALRQALGQADLCINSVPTFAGHQMAIFEALRSGNGRDLRRLRWHGCLYGKAEAAACPLRGRRRDRYHRTRRRSRNLEHAVPGGGGAARPDRSHQPLLGGQAGWAGKSGPRASLCRFDRARRICQSLAAVSRGALREMPPLSGHEVLDLPEPWGRTD